MKAWFKCPQCGTKFQEFTQLRLSAQCPRCFCLSHPINPWATRLFVAVVIAGFSYAMWRSTH
jgi:hypothetical protein